MEHKLIRIGFTGGGTGGHVFPGIAVIDALKEIMDYPSPADVSTACTNTAKVNSCGVFFWIGSPRGIEKNIVQNYGIPFLSIPAGKLRRYFSLRNITDIFMVAAGFIKALFILHKLKPQVLFSKGGYVSVPAVAAAKILKIAVVSHESDLSPGLATIINSRFSDIICCGYPETTKKLKNTDTVVTGNPVRREILQGNREKGRALFGIPSAEKVVLVLGGSLGAQEINTLTVNIIKSLTAICTVIHQMGTDKYSPSSHPKYHTSDFFTTDFPHVLAAADLVISRAGAGTLWENGVTGKPAILIPLGTHASRGDQIDNASYFADRGAAKVLTTNTGNALLSLITNLLDSEHELTAMATSAQHICPKDSAHRIAALILQQLDKNI